MKPVSVRWSSLSAVAAFSLLTACADHSPGTSQLASLGPRSAVQAFTCVANVKSHALSCTSADTGAARNSVQTTAPGVRRNITVGGQNIHVTLTSSNVAYDAGTQAFTFDVTVTNLMEQSMGTSDGVTADPTGIRVFFQQDPTATSLIDNSGSSAISINNADGTATFTATNQSYYQYAGSDLGADGILSTNETSSAKTWSFNVDPNVNSFQFLMYVNAAVPHELGYVDVTASDSNMVSGATLALTAVVHKPAGDTTISQTVTWTSSDTTLATVDGSGNVTALAPGHVTITATDSSGLRSGSLALGIAPNLAVGDVYRVSGAAAASLVLSGATGAEYTVTPFNSDQSNSVSLTATAVGVQAVTGPPTPNLLTPESPSLRNALGVSNVSLSQLQASASAEMNLRLAERSTLPAFSASTKITPTLLARATIGTSVLKTPTGIRRTIVPGSVTLGDSMDINVATGCSGTTDIRRGVIRSVNGSAIILADTANPAGGFTTAQYDSIAAEFDTLAYRVDTTNFGVPTDVDNNSRIVIFFTRAVNELSAPASSTSILGYTQQRDFFSTDPVSGCERSNAGEIMYMMVPDPTGVVNSNVRTVSFVRGNTTPTETKQLQHLINAGRHVYVNGASGFEDPWLEEGLSDIASELVFYQASFGLAPKQNIIVTNLTTGTFASRRVAAFNTYANGNYGMLRSWLQRPDTSGVLRSPFYGSGPTNDLNPAVNLAEEGVTWAFLRYAADRQTGSQATFWFNLVNSTSTGLTNLQSAIGGADPMTWMTDFTTALYTDDAVSVSSEYTFPSWNLRSLYTALNGSYQLVPRTLSNGVPLTLSYANTAAAYWRFGVPASGFGTLTVSSGGSNPPSTVSLTIVRTK